MDSPEFRAAFVINARDKEKYVAQAVRGALAQDYPCHIILSDQGSKDRTKAVMQEEVDAYLAAVGEGSSKHKIEIVDCPVKGEYSMATQNRHVDWLVDQTEAEWFFQCSADDYSLPGRVSACMSATALMPCASVVTNQWFNDRPGEPVAADTPRSQMPGGYIPAGWGLTSLVFGSCIAAYKRSFLKKIGPAPGSVTMDVWCGYQAALDDGFVVVPEPLHVHQRVADVKNMGFGGRLKGAELAQDWDGLARINELNHFQLFELYFECHLAQQSRYPLAHANDQSAPVNMMLGQAIGWYRKRKELHDKKLTPGIM